MLAALRAALDYLRWQIGIIPKIESNFARKKLTFVSGTAEHPSGLRIVEFYTSLPFSDIMAKLDLFSY